MFLYGAASFSPPKRLSRAWVGNGFVISTDSEQIFQPDDILSLKRVSYFGRRRCSSIMTRVTELGKKLQKSRVILVKNSDPTTRLGGTTVPGLGCGPTEFPLSTWKEHPMAAPMPPAPVGLKLTQASTPTVVVEMFHDVCCPFSKKMYDTVDGGVLPTLADKGLSDQIDFVWQSVPQPWHAQSCLMHDAVMAAFLIDAPRIGDYLRSVFAQQTDFFDDTTKDTTRMEVYARLAAIGRQCGYDPDAISAKLSLEGVQGNGGLGDVTQMHKWSVKYHRGRGVHITPTVFINGLEANDVSSEWTSDEWMAKLEPMVA